MLFIIKKYSLIFFLLFLISGTLYSQVTLDSSIACLLYDDRDYENAAKEYKKLFGKTQENHYFISYAKCLYRLEKFEKAEKLLGNKAKRDNNSYFIDELKNLQYIKNELQGRKAVPENISAFKGWLGTKDKNRYDIDQGRKAGQPDREKRSKEQKIPKDSLDDQAKIPKDSLKKVIQIKKNSLTLEKKTRYQQDSLQKVITRRKKISTDSILSFNYFLELEYKKAGELFYRLYYATHSKLYLSFYLNSLIKENKVRKAKRMVRREIKNTGDFSLMKTFRDFKKYEDKYLRPDEKNDSIVAFNYFKEKNFFDASESFRALYNNTNDTLYLKYYLYSLKKMEDYHLARKVINEELEKKNSQFIIDNITYFNRSYLNDSLINIDKTYHKDSLNIYEVDKDSLLFKDQRHIARNDLLFYYNSNKLIIKYKHDVFDEPDNNDIKNTKYYEILRSVLSKVLKHEISIFDYYRENYVIGLKIEDFGSLFGMNDMTRLVANETDSIRPANDIDLDNSIEHFSKKTGKLFFVENWYFNRDDFIFEKQVYAIGPYLNDTSGYISSNNYIENVPFITLMDEINNINIDHGKDGSDENIIVIKNICYNFNLYNKQYSDLMDDDSFKGTLKEFKDWFRNKNDWCKDLNGNRLVNLILNEVLSGRTSAYDYNTDKKLDIKEINNRCGKKVDSVWVTDFYTGLDFLHIVEEKINIDDFHNIIFIEDWYYDENRFSFKKAVKSIALVRTEKIYVSNRQTLLKENIVFKVNLNTNLH